MSTTSSESPDRRLRAATRSHTASSAVALPANGTTTSTDGRPLRSALFAPSDTAARLSRLALAAVSTLAALNFAWQLGSSSFYVDEVVSVQTSLSPLSHLLHAVSTLQVSPLAYYAFLHEWLLRIGLASEWVARLPSAVAGVLLVGAVHWVCSLLEIAPAAKRAAVTLAALSPFLLQLAQLAEPYVFAGLACTLALGAALKADTPSNGRWWLAAALVASVLALCLHYTATLVIAPLCAWVATRSSLPRGWRAAFVIVCAAAEVALLPLLISQHHAHPGRPGVAVSGALNSGTLASMLDVPFAGRVQALEPLGIAVTLSAVTVVLLGALRARQATGRRAVTPRELVVALAVGEPLCLVVLSLFGGRHFWGHLMLIRYAAVALPFLIVTFALAFESLPAPSALALAGCMLAVAITGTLDSHRPSGFYLDARGAVAYVQRHALPGDAVVATSDVIAAVPLSHYGLGRLHPLWADARDAPALAYVRSGRTWVIAEEPQTRAPSAAAALAYERALLRGVGERPLATRTFAGIPGLLVVLIAPFQRRNIPPG